MSEATSQNGRMIHLQQYLIEYYFTKQKNGFFLRLIKNVNFSIPGVFI